MLDSYSSLLTFFLQVTSPNNVATEDTCEGPSYARAIATASEGPSRAIASPSLVDPSEGYASPDTTIGSNIPASNGTAVDAVIFHDRSNFASIGNEMIECSPSEGAREYPSYSATEGSSAGTNGKRILRPQGMEWIDEFSLRHENAGSSVQAQTFEPQVNPLPGLTTAFQALFASEVFA